MKIARLGLLKASAHHTRARTPRAGRSPKSVSSSRKVVRAVGVVNRRYQRTGRLSPLYVLRERK